MPVSSGSKAFAVPGFGGEFLVIPQGRKKKSHVHSSRNSEIIIVAHVYRDLLGHQPPARRTAWGGGGRCPASGGGPQAQGAPRRRRGPVPFSHPQALPSEVTRDCAKPRHSWPCAEARASHILVLRMVSCTHYTPGEQVYEAPPRPQDQEVVNE